MRLNSDACSLGGLLDLKPTPLTAKHKVATPVNWNQGEDVIIVTAVSEEEAKQKFPQGWKAPKPYMRIVSQPK